MSTRDRSWWNRYRQVRKEEYERLKENGDYDSYNPEHRYLREFSHDKDKPKYSKNPHSTMYRGRMNDSRRGE